MSELRGRYPGGPSRKAVPGDPTKPKRAARLHTVEEIEARAAAGSEARRQRRRRKRLAMGVLVSVIVAGSVGIWVGFQSHRSDEEVAEELRGRARGLEFDLNKEADRLISEMWKTEALEKLPGGR